MSNPGVSFDGGLIQPASEANASIAGVPLRINPSSVSLPFTMKFNQTQTVGGMVVQLFGTTWGDLVVQGQFGAGQWQEQATFFTFIQGLATSTAKAQFKQVIPNESLVNPDGAVRFLFPLLGYDFMVFLKSFTSLEGSTVTMRNDIINPTWQLTMTIDNDNAGLQQVAIDSYLARLAKGVGYEINKYNSPDVNPQSTYGGDLQTFLQSATQLDPSLTQMLSQIQGYAPSSSSTVNPLGPATSLPANTIPSGSQLSMIQQALVLAQVEATQANEQAVNIIVTNESHWDANAINNWDSNAAQGQPSQGLMQTIPSTFQEWALPGYNTNILDPLSNLIAGIRYAVNRYGSLLQVPGVAAVSNGKPYVEY